MKNCFKSLLVISAVGVLFAAMPMAGCTKVDDSLGYNLLPDDQQMTLRIDTLRGIDTYSVMADSIPTGRLGRMLIGRMQSDVFGKTECGTVLQFVPSQSNSKNTLNPYGYKPVVDSLFLLLQIEEIYGDKKIPQKFYVYRFEPQTPLHFDTLYYRWYDAESAIDRSKPLFSFSMEDEEVGYVDKELEVLEPYGREFLKELAGLDTLVYTQSDTVFRKIFQGFYIAPSEDPAEAPENAAVYDISPLSYNTYGAEDVTYLMLYAHNHKKNPAAGDVWHDCEAGHLVVDNDSLVVTYSFDDTGDLTTYPNTSIVTIKHDYTGSSIDASKFIDPDNFDPATAQKADPVYVQGMAGVSTYLHFNDEFVENLRSLAYLDNGEPAAMMINRAYLIYNLEEGSNAEIMDGAQERLGMYYYYKGSNPENIPDYLYREEVSYNFKAAYGGYLNRGLECYEMDISMYVRALVNDIEDDTLPKHVWLSPAVPIQFQGKEVVIQNGLDQTGDPLRWKNNIQLRLVYTLVPKN